MIYWSVQLIFNSELLQYEICVLLLVNKSCTLVDYKSIKDSNSKTYVNHA